MDSQPAITVLVRRSGAVIRVLNDELGLARCFPAGVPLTSLVEPESSAQAEQLLREIHEDKTALDVKLKMMAANEPVSLFFTGYKTSRGFKLVGAREPLSRGRLLLEVAQSGDRISEGFTKSKPESIGLARRDLLARTAHEMRNHLNGILAASQYLIEDAAALLETEHVTLLRSIETTGRAMYKLMDDIGEAFAIEAGGVERDLNPTDVLSIIKKNLSANGSRADGQRIRLELVTPGTVPLIEVDPVRISRVIDTLLTNAIVFSSSGGEIKVTVAVEDQQVLISMWVKKTDLSAEDLRRIIYLDPSGIKEVKTATVLAFVVARRIAEDHGGAIYVEEGDAGQGLIISLELLIHREAPKEKAQGHRG